MMTSMAIGNDGVIGHSGPQPSQSVYETNPAHDTPTSVQTPLVVVSSAVLSATKVSAVVDVLADAAVPARATSRIVSRSAVTVALAAVYVNGAVLTRPPPRRW